MIDALAPATRRRLKKLVLALVLGSILGGLGGWQYTTRNWSPARKEVLSVYSQGRVLDLAGIRGGGAIKLFDEQIAATELVWRIRDRGQEPFYSRAFRQVFIYGPAIGAATLTLILVLGTLVLENRK